MPIKTVRLAEIANGTSVTSVDLRVHVCGIVYNGR